MKVVIGNIIEMNKLNFINKRDILVIVTTLLFLEIPGIVFRLLMNKIKINPCTNKAYQRARKTTICRYCVMYFLSFVIFSFGLINTQWIILDNEKKGNSCNIVKDFCFTVFVDLVMYQFLLLVIKTFMYVIIIKWGENSLAGTLIACLATAMPFLFSLDG